MEDTPRIMLRLAQAYVPMQVFITRWDPMKGLMLGTIFPELYRSYHNPYREGMRK